MEGIPIEPTKESQESLMSAILSLCLTAWPLAVSQCRDAPARTGKREDDEKTADDRTVKLRPCCLEMARCLRSLPFLGLGVLTVAR